MGSKRIFLSNSSISYQQWGSPNATKKVLAIHGWLDNSNSFQFLGPYLGDRGFHVVAYDNIGHGHSSHESASSNNYNVAPYVGRCRDIIEALKWDTCSIVGHSLGASLTTLFAGTHPEIVQRIALIDGFATPLTQPAPKAAANFRRAIDSERKYKARLLESFEPKLYKTLSDAIAARMASVNTYPGKQFLSFEAASTLVARYKHEMIPTY
jgi:pimeloyl-ACP methyl ester carboxylesterase